MGFYGHPNLIKREEGWNLLKYLKNSISRPWLCMGDYNEIVTQSEK